MTRATVALLTTLTISACASYASYRSTPDAPPPVEDAVARLVLVGDAGENSAGRDAVLDHLGRELEDHARQHPDIPTLVAYLGDNIYDWGARQTHRDEDLAKLTPQVMALPPGSRVRGVFLPGNHDWGHGGAVDEGRTALEVQQAWIDEIGEGRAATFLPADECPGPEVVEIADDVFAIFIDTEWLLRRPGDCEGEDVFYRRLSEELAQRPEARIVLAAHHPLATGGPHGGNLSWYHKGPLVYYLAVKSGLSVQDLSSGRYSHMLERIREAIASSGTRPLAMAAGHDHSLQVIGMAGDGAPYFQLVSGSASKSTPAGRIEGTRYADDAHGYMRIDFTEGGARLAVMAWDPEVDRVRPVFHCHLQRDGAPASCPEAPSTAEEGP